MPGSTIYVYESEIPEYYQYINGRYAFTVDFPKTFFVALLPANNDGANFKLPDGSAELTVAGGHIPLGDTLDDFIFEHCRGLKEEKDILKKEMTGL